MVETRAQQAATAAEKSDISQDPTPDESPAGFGAVNIHSISLKKVDSDEADQQLIQEQESANRESARTDMNEPREKAKRSRRGREYKAAKRAAREQMSNAGDASTVEIIEQ